MSLPTPPPCPHVAHNSVCLIDENNGVAGVDEVAQFLSALDPEERVGFAVGCWPSGCDSSEGEGTDVDLIHDVVVVAYLPIVENETSGRCWSLGPTASMFAVMVAFRVSLRELLFVQSSEAIF